MRAFLLLTALIIFQSFYIYAQDTVKEGDLTDTLILNTDLFEGDEPLNITIKFDIRAYQKNKEEGEYMPAELIYHINDTLEINKSVRIKARGNFRRSYCSMPPFWLNIKNANIKISQLHDVTKIKVVTHCKTGKSSGDYILKEFLAYRIYNLISPYSFRVRLIKMKYIDTGKKDRETESWAFLIEPEELFANRLNVIPIENDRLGMEHMLPEDMDRVAMFQFMIGNSDYSITGRHNVKIMGLKETGTMGFIPVPYDFDYSGLVNAHYAVPGENLSITKVTERYYQGACRDNSSVQSTIDDFILYREEILDLLQSFPFLADKVKNEIISYLEEFYNMTEGRFFISKNIESTCR